MANFINFIILISLSLIFPFFPSIQASNDLKNSSSNENTMFVLVDKDDSELKFESILNKTKTSQESSIQYLITSPSNEESNTKSNNNFVENYKVIFIVVVTIVSIILIVLIVLISWYFSRKIKDKRLLEKILNDPEFEDYFYSTDYINQNLYEESYEDFPYDYDYE